MVGNLPTDAVRRMWSRKRVRESGGREGELIVVDWQARGGRWRGSSTLEHEHGSGDGSDKTARQGAGARLGRRRRFNASAEWSMRKRRRRAARIGDGNRSVATRPKREWEQHALASLLLY
jgi:hypothetical protein